MIKKIEAWFRKLIADEVRVMYDTIGNVETRLEGERQKLSSHVEILFQGLEGDAARLLREFKQDLVNEAAVVLAEKNKLIAELHEKVAALEETTHKIAHWKADSSTVASDDSLKLVK